MPKWVTDVDDELDRVVRDYLNETDVALAAFLRRCVVEYLNARGIEVKSRVKRGGYRPRKQNTTSQPSSNKSTEGDRQ